LLIMNIRRFVRCVSRPALLVVALAVVSQHPARAQLDDAVLNGKPFNCITLEASLKPFKKNDKADIMAVASEMFIQWHSLLRHTDTVAVMLWTSDGSEILDYRGDLRQSLEWAKYLGNPNTAHEVGAGPEELS